MNKPIVRNALERQIHKIRRMSKRLKHVRDMAALTSTGETIMHHTYVNEIIEVMDAMDLEVFLFMGKPASEVMLKSGHPIFYDRFPSTGVPLRGVITKLDTVHGVKGAWVVCDNEVYFTPLSKIKQQLGIVPKQPEIPWVSVSESLPEKEDGCLMLPCLVRYVWTDCDGNKHYALGEDFFDNDASELGGEWLENNGAVTHWVYMQDLPMPSTNDSEEKL